MLHIPIEVSGLVMGFIPIAKIPMLTGSPEGMVTGARVPFEGDLSGHMLFMLPEASWELCKRLLISGDYLQNETVEISAFAEIANIACCSFIANLSDITGLSIRFSPPEVMKEMSATVLEDTLIVFSDSPELLTIETTFFSVNSQFKGFLFFIPYQTGFRAMLGRLEKTKPPLTGS